MAAEAVFLMQSLTFFLELETVLILFLLSWMIDGLVLGLQMFNCSVSHSFSCSHNLYSSLLICNPFGFQLL